MKLSQKVVPIIVFAVLLGGIGLARLTGVWATTTDKVPARYNSGDFAGQYNPADIRGSYTFADVARLFDIDEQVLLSAFALPEDTDPALFQNKNLEERYSGLDVEIGNESVQVFVALYNQLPFDLGEAALPQSAAEILEARSDLTPEQRDWLRSHTVTVGQVNPSPQPEISHEPSTQVNGKTTFQNLLDAGLSRQQIETVLGQAMPATNQTVKDFCLAHDLSFSDIKGALAALLAP